jgi:hypothetical protein
MGELMHLIEIVDLGDDTVEIIYVPPFAYTPRKIRLGAVELVQALAPYEPGARAGALLTLLGDSNEGDSKDKVPHERPRRAPDDLLRERLGRIDIGLQDTLPLPLLRLIADMAAPNVSVHRLWSLRPDATPGDFEAHRSFDFDISAEEEGGSNEGGSNED